MRLPLSLRPKSNQLIQMMKNLVYMHRLGAVIREMSGKLAWNPLLF